MSLSKRDTLVKYMDPKHIFWQDAEGHMHVSLENACLAFDLMPTPANMAAVGKLVREILTEHLPADQRPERIIERTVPDSEDYWKQQFPPS